MFHHEWMLLILMSKMYYSEYLKWGVIVTMLPSAGLETGEEGVMEFQRRVNNVKETIATNTKDNPKY
jgi:hypothetical protein